MGDFEVLNKKFRFMLKAQNDMALILSVTNCKLIVGCWYMLKIFKLIEYFTT